MAVRQRKDGRWVVAGRPGYWPDEPNRQMEYFGKGPAAEAEARSRDAELGGVRYKVVAADGPAFAELAVVYIKEKRFAPKSHRELIYRLERTIFPIIGHRRALRLTHTDMDSYVDKRRNTIANRKKTPVKDSTIRREVTDIKSIFSWAAKRHPPLIAFNPIVNYQPPPSDDEVIIPPTATEAAAIYRAASEHLRRVITLSYYLGLRPGAVELLRLTWDDILTELGVIRIQSANKGGARIRHVPIHPGLAKHIAEWGEKDSWEGPVIHYHGKPITKIQTSWRGALQRAKIKRRLQPYSLRHAFVTTALERGADIGALSEIVGSRPETLRRHYQHVSKELTIRTVGLIPELDTGPQKVVLGKKAVSQSADKAPEN